MAEKFQELQAKHIAFIEAQKIYFVASAGADGYVNLSPKGMDSLKIITPRKLIWLNLTGSGNETAAHVLENGRMTIMLCSFDTKPLILRVYGTAQTVHPHDANWDELVGQFPDHLHTGARQIFDVNINLVQTSCGYAVPFYEFGGERNTLTQWAEKKGRDGVKEYWAEKNLTSLNGKPTGMEENTK